MTTGKRSTPSTAGHELQELVRTIAALRAAEGEALIQRNSAIVASYNHGVSPTYIGDSASVDRTWVYTLAKTHPGDLYEWRQDHPDPVEVLEAARAQIGVLIRKLRGERLQVPEVE